MLNYRAFEATIVLKSYRDRLIDMFDATTLFERLYYEAGDHDMIPCGDGLCFKKGISVRGCHCKSQLWIIEVVIICHLFGTLIDYFGFSYLFLDTRPF